MAMCTNAHSAPPNVPCLQMHTLCIYPSNVLHHVAMVVYICITIHLNTWIYVSHEPCPIGVYIYVCMYVHLLVIISFRPLAIRKYEMNFLIAGTHLDIPVYNLSHGLYLRPNAHTNSMSVKTCIDTFFVYLKYNSSAFRYIFVMFCTIGL